MKGVLRNFAEDVAAGKFVRLGAKNEIKVSFAGSQCEFFSTMPRQQLVFKIGDRHANLVRLILDIVVWIRH